MPFIDPESRHKFPLKTDITLELAATPIPGEKCFLYYREMLGMWRQSPRWTTAHEVYKTTRRRHYNCPNDQFAAELAWQVFFQLHVMPYEVKKRKENGEVETE